ncbi:MAG: flagellar hook-basal body complex protein FliE [Phycisphaerales bacterium]|nr:flagellar hook-basal body complex protein FliE [Phycisphaerales bacterium]
MTDPLGLIRPTDSTGPAAGPVRGSAGGPAVPGAEFKDVLLENLKKVNELQQDATKAMEDLHTGRRTDYEGVIIATQKADTAFHMLQALRNKVMEAYDEIKQMRV